MMQPVRISKEQVVRQYRTEEILAAARRVIESEGLSAARLERIAEEAGVAKGTIYLYFKSKECLIGEVLRELQEHLLDEVREAVEEAESAKSKVRAIIRAHLNFAHEQMHLMRAVFIEPGDFAWKRDGFSIDEYLNRQARYESILAEVIQGGISSGEFQSVHTASSAIFLYELLKGLVARVILGQIPSESDFMAGQLENIFFHGVAK